MTSTPEKAFNFNIELGPEVYKSYLSPDDQARIVAQARKKVATPKAVGFKDSDDLPCHSFDVPGVSTAGEYEFDCWTRLGEIPLTLCIGISGYQTDYPNT
jgi:hypothetical protein